MWGQAMGQAMGHQLTQLYASRNLRTSELVGWSMGGLNYHAVHHAFPAIPFNQLPIAWDRIQMILEQHDRPPLVAGSGYSRETIRLSTQPLLIGTPNPDDATGRYHMVIPGI